MTQSKHTPAPWNLSDCETSITALNKEGEQEQIFDLTGACGCTDDNVHEVDGNLQLILAAPELLEALVIAHRNLKPLYPSDHYVMRATNQAIAKAKGE